MRLLYIADNGFSEHNGVFYYSRPNAVNTSQYVKYFNEIIYIARSSTYAESMLPIDINAKVTLIGRYDFSALKKAMYRHGNSYDAVLVRNGLLGCFAAMYAKRLGKCVISYCGADPYEFQISTRTLRGIIIAHIWRRLERRKMEIADYAQYCTKALYNRYPCTGKYIICSNVSIDSNPAVLEKKLKNGFGRQGVFRLGIVGQYKDNDSKGISDIIRAMALINNDCLFLEIVGDGLPHRYTSLLEKFHLLDRVSFLGYYNDKEKLNEWLDSLDIYLQPSLSEGLPRATIEAMSRGLPVVASNVCGITDLLEPAYLIKPRDYRSLAAIISRLISSPYEMSESAKNNFSVASKYSTDIRNSKLDDFYSKITKQNHSDE